jgi:hypothetical protein
MDLKTSELRRAWGYCLTLSRSGVAGGVHAGPGVGMKRDGRASCPGSLGNFQSREWNEDFGLAAREGEMGRG